METIPYNLLAAQNDQITTVKTTLEAELQSVLPAGSFTVIVRNYGGDVRSPDPKKDNLQCLITLRPEARPLAIQRRADLEAMGYRVSSDGRISRN